MTCSNPSCGYVVQSTDQKFCPKCGAFLPLPEQADAADPLVGQPILDGKYRISSVIGEGGMGKVYLAEQKMGTATRKVAIKTLQPELANDPQIIARFHRETQTVIELEHPNTIKFYDFGDLPTPDGKKFLFIAMEFIQGETLAHVLARGSIDGVRAERIMTQVCGSLQEAHEKGIIHRDLKPDNIYLTQKGARGDFVKVLDFGIAKRSEAADDKEAKLTKQGMVLGTPPYMSPEQFTGQALDARSDIYALGVIAYEMLTGQLPFTAATPWEWATKHLTAPPTPIESQPNGASVPARYRDAIMKALRKNRDERQKNVIEFLQDFAGTAVGAVDWTSSTNFTSAGSNAAPTPPQPATAGLPPPPVLPPTGGFTPNNTVPSPVQQAPMGMAGSPTPNPFAAPPIGGGGGPQSSGPFGQQPTGAGGATGSPFATGPMAGGGGYAPAPSNAGFAAVPPQVPSGGAGSNPSFPQPPNAFGAMGSMAGTSAGAYGATGAQPAQPKKSKTGLVVALVLGAVILVGGIAAAVVSGDDEEDSHNNTAQNTQQHIANNTTGMQGTGTTNPVLVQPNPNGTGTVGPQINPIPNGVDPNNGNAGTQTPTNNGTDPNNGAGTQTPTNNGTQTPTNNGTDPNNGNSGNTNNGNTNSGNTNSGNTNSGTPTRTSSPAVAEGMAALSRNDFGAAVRAVQSALSAGDSAGAARLRSSMRSRGRNRIDNLILADQCSAAQALYRQLRAAGAAPNAGDSFGDSCRAP
ncbi:MAG: protein kinase [Myxococcales bacterium]|nr:protein kinase [Myxococcales bacterium]